MEWQHPFEDRNFLLTHYDGWYLRLVAPWSLRPTADEQIEAKFITNALPHYLVARTPEETFF